MKTVFIIRNRDTVSPQAREDYAAYVRTQMTHQYPVIFLPESCGVDVVEADEVPQAAADFTAFAAAQAMAEIWALVCPDCGPGDYQGIIDAVKRLHDEVAASKY